MMIAFAVNMVEQMVDRKINQLEVFFPWEQAVLLEVIARLSSADQTAVWRQLKCLRLVQRHRDGSEVNLYGGWRWRAIHSLNRLSIARHSQEMEIAAGMLLEDSGALGFKLFAVDAALFSLEFSKPPAPVFSRWDVAVDGIRRNVKIINMVMGDFHLLTKGVIAS